LTAHLPKGELLYAVGDIHGRSDLLAKLLRQIEVDAEQQDAAKKTLLFIGDYVDRGPDSRGVVEMLLHGLPKGFSAHFLKGNHEELLLQFLDDARRLDHWRMNGGEETLVSYGVDVDQLIMSDAPPETWREAFMVKLPPAHFDFLRHLSITVQKGDYLFVHAGIRPDVPLHAQDDFDLIWIRDEFLNATEPFGKVVVHGHTPVISPVVRPNRIDIDTGAVFSGCLTALKLKDGERSFLQT
jgi:diadenosine tetraphosphatase ApaH/serine/threonine PP2A family protein phosphatase